jgi:ABC-type sugar transport system, periplasmic component
MPEEPVTLNIMGGAHLTSVVEVVLKDYLAAHPNVTVNFEKYSYAEYPTKMRTQLSGGESVPDIMIVHDVFISQFIDAGWLMDLTSMADTDNLLPIMGTATVDGKIYGIPNQATLMYVFMYRQDVYDELGLTPPATFDEYIEQALKLKENGYFAGAFLPTAPTETFMWYMNMLGGRIFDNEGNPVLDKAIEAIELINKGIEAGIYHPSSQGSSEGDYWAAFNEGKIAAFPAVSHQAAYYESNVDPDGKGGFGQLRVAPAMKFAPDAPNTYVHNTEYFTINAKTEHPEAAQALLAYLAQSEEACLKFSNVNENGIMAKYTTAYLPGIAKVIEVGTDIWNAFGDQQVITEFAKILSDASIEMPYKDARFSESTAIMDMVLGEMFTNNAYTPEEAVKEIINQINDI